MPSGVVHRMFDTKIVIVVREDLLTWQKLNVTAFLTSGVIGDAPDLLGAPYRDADGISYRPLLVQPTIVLTADAGGLAQIHARALSRDISVAVYIEDMFATGHDEANRATVAAYSTGALPLVGLGLRADKKSVDKVTKGARMHP